MARLLISRQMPETVVAAARAMFDVTERKKPVPMDQAEAVSALGEYDAILPTLGDDFSALTFQMAGQARCKILANFGVGYNHIDVDAAKGAGILVSNTPGAVTDATADIGVMLILMAARRASEGEALVRRGDWAGWGPTQLLGLHISGKTLGIIGMGRIGRAIAHRCHYGFGMGVVFHNRSLLPDLGMPATQLDSPVDVAHAADILVVALPGGVETRHLINGDIFQAMPNHGVLVNIARGEIVDEQALIHALQLGQIAGAGLDVYEFEPQVPDALRTCPNVTLLPHMGTAALEVRESMGRMALDNLLAWKQGQDLPNRV